MMDQASQLKLQAWLDGELASSEAEDLLLAELIKNHPD